MSNRCTYGLSYIYERRRLSIWNRYCVQCITATYWLKVGSLAGILYKYISVPVHTCTMQLFAESNAFNLLNFELISPWWNFLANFFFWQFQWKRIQMNFCALIYKSHKCNDIQYNQTNSVLYVVEGNIEISHP